MKRTIRFLAVVMLTMCASGFLFANEKEKKTHVDLAFSVNFNFGCYKETTFSNISQSILSPRFQIDTKIYSGDFLHIITADYFFCRPDSAMTRTTVIYRNYDPLTGEPYYESSNSNLSFHRIRLQYDLGYDVLKNEKYSFYVGGNFACNAYLQFENYGVRPSFAGCDALLMKYAEEDFIKILTLGNFLSLHNYQALYFDIDYKFKVAKYFSTGAGFGFEYSRIAIPQERPLYFVNGCLKASATINF